MGLPLFGDRKPFPYLQTEFDERSSRFSPNGRWVAYISDENRRYEVYVQPFPATGAKWQISTRGGGLPAWRYDGKELFYIAPDQKLMAVPVTSDAASFEAGIAQPLFEVRAAFPMFARGYDVSADGKRFLINTAFQESSTQPIHVIVNWPAKFSRDK